jgi:Cdc6-like AAA superfamily ATPase
MPNGSVNPPGTKYINQSPIKSKILSKAIDKNTVKGKPSSSSSSSLPSVAVVAPSSSAGLSSSVVTVKSVLASTTAAPPLTGLTLRAQLDLAVTNLDIGRNPEPQERENEMNEIQDVITGSLIALSKGHGHDMSNDVNNVFAGGMPGYGKTLSVEALLRQMEAKQKVREEEEEIPISQQKKKSKKKADDQASEDVLPKFVVVKIIGVEVRQDTLYQTIARELGMDSESSRSTESIVSGIAYHGSNMSATREERLKKEILARFRNERQCLGKGNAAREADPVTILMIDEIDKAPRNIIKELLEIAADATYNITSTSGPFACRVVIVGISNNILFNSEVNISYRAKQAFKMVAFEPYKLAELKSILIKRCMGTFSDGAIAMLAGRGLRAASGNFKRLETIDLLRAITGNFDCCFFAIYDVNID